MITRRDYLKQSALLGAVAALPACAHSLAAENSLITRAIPGTGEKLPIVGLGTSATFRAIAMSDDTQPLSDVLQALVERGGTVLDTAPSYANAEEISGRLAREANLTNKLFWATKVNAVPRGANSADPRAVRAQIHQSFGNIGTDPIDLIQVHNVADVATQMPIITELKQAGKIRYTGVTSTRKNQYPELERTMRDYPVDFIGIDYAVDNTSAADLILPLAKERGIAVLVYVPFGRTRLWERVKGRDLPAWAQEFDVTSWAQFFIKYAASHPDVTCVTPATSRPHHMLDNMGAAYGALPDAKLRRRMESFIDALPSA